MRDTVEIGEWYKDGYFWRKKSVDKSDGKGDLIFNTCKRIIDQEDTSDWAYTSLFACSILLQEGYRWAARMSDNTDCNTWIQRIVNRTTRDILLKFGIKIHPNFRYRGRMSRDPFIAFYTACLLLGEPEYIEFISPQWYLYSPTTWKWRRRLIEDNRDDYVIRLGYLRAKSVVLKYEKNLTG